MLKLYNITADKGNENSRVAKHKGLLYHALDEKGNRIGVPIKASRFYEMPTLKNLEKKFSTNEIKRQPNKSKIKTSIDSAFLNGKIIILPQLIKRLQKEGIDTVLRQNTEGVVYGVTFIDHKTKSVFNGSSFGKAYSAKGFQDKCALNREKIKKGESATYSKKELADLLQEYRALINFKGLTDLLEIFMKVENNFDYVAKEFKKYRRKNKLK